MGKGLEGKRIVIGGSRKIEEICTIIKKQDGIPVVRSLQGTVFLAEKEVEPDLRKFIDNGADWVVFTTGIGTETLVNLAEKLGLKDQLLKIVHNAKVASRGYKTLAALKKLAIIPDAIDEDGTTMGLTRSLKNINFSGKKVMIQLHGEKAPVLTKFFEDHGARVHKILPYQHIAPESETVKKLCKEMINNEVDAVCFTTAIQVRSLFEFAKEHGNYNIILHSLNQHVVPVAVGKVTAEALREEGIKQIISPANERMGAMIMELSQYYQNK